MIPDSKNVITAIEQSLMVKSKVSDLLKGKNPLEQSIVISAPNETFNLLQVK